MSKVKKMQAFLRHYREATGETEIDMRKVAEFAKLNGWELPKPKDPVDILAKEFAKAARDEIECSGKSGRPYRRNHALQVRQGKSGEPHFVWIDINDATRTQMDKSLKLRREQMVGDGLQL